MTFNGYFTEHDSFLENYLGITDPNELTKVESEIVPLRIAEILKNPPDGDLDFKYLCDVHRFLFSDIYLMAGHVRTVDIAKGNSAFCYAQFIAPEQKRIFEKADKAFSSDNLFKDEFVARLTELSSDLNALHPFREGNGRTIRTFLSIVCMRHGYNINFDNVNTEVLLSADVAAFYGNLDLLRELYSTIIE